MNGSGRGPAVAPATPPVSVIVPVGPGEETVARAVGSALAQDYRGTVEIVIADGTGASEFAAFAAREFPDARVVANPEGITPAGLNRAIAAASHDILVRLDARAELPPDYVARAVQTLRETGAGCVGGRLVPAGTTAMERAAGLAMTTPLGAGDARWRIGGEAGPTDTVYMGVYRRDALEAAGGFEAGLPANQDYELNVRLRQAGETVWFDPAIAARYRPRGSVRAVAVRYWQYGYWKRAMLRLHPGSVRWRQLAPPLAVLALAASIGAGAAGATAALALAAAYLLLLVGAAAGAGLRRRRPEAVLMPVLLAAMHLCWGAGFLWSSVAGPRPGAGGTQDGPAWAVAGIGAGIAVLLALPFVFYPATAFPFVTPKALFSRTLIELVFVFWVVLALRHRSFAPPRSVLLALLGAGVAVSLAASLAGVGSERSLWSHYARQGGLVDGLHWLALAAVLASSVRTARGWRRLLALQTGVGLALALLAVSRARGVELPWLGLIPERNFPRIGVTIGNAAWLGWYMAVHLWIALGLVARSFLVAAQARPGGAGPASAARWGARVFYLAAAVLGLWALALSGSMAALAAVGAGALFAGAGWAFATAGRMRLAALAATGAIAGAGVLSAVLVLAPALDLHRGDPPAAAPVRPGPADWAMGGAGAENPLAGRMTHPAAVASAMTRRLAAWEAGLEGIAQRPLLGWGPENFIVAFGRHAAGAAEDLEVHDRAHNLLIEEAVGAGVPGLVLHVLLWSVLFTVVLRAARTMAAGDRALVLCIGASAAAHFTVGQLQLSMATSALQFTVLFAFAVHLEARAGGRPAWLAARPSGRAKGRAGRGLRALVLVAALGVVAAGLHSNIAIGRGASALYLAETSGRFMHHLGRAIDAFAPLANTPRAILFENLAGNWRVLRRERPEEALRLLAWADREAESAVRAEPANWRLRHSLVRLYATVSSTEPAYSARARHHLARARTLAPARPVLASREVYRRGAGQ